MRSADAISLIEAAYRLDTSNEQWLETMAAMGAAAFGSSQGAMAFRYDASSGDRIDSGIPGLHLLSPEFVHEVFDQEAITQRVGSGMAQVFMSVRFGSLRTVIEQLQIESFGAILDRHGVGDMIAVNGLDPSGRGCMLVLTDRKRTVSPRTVHVWHRLGAHISAGNRLRAQLDALTRGSLDPNHAEAVLAPNGKVEHATGLAEPRAAREALRNALVRIDAARSEPDDARRSVDLWRGLVAGRWSLVEHFERDGKRYYLAHKNDPELTPDRALTRRERQVLGYAELGHSNKLIAYSLGLSSSTIGTLLNRARRKLVMAGTSSDDQR